MKRGTHLLAPGPENIKVGFVREFMLLLDGISVGDKAHKKERVHPCNVCDKAFKSLPTAITSTQFSTSTCGVRGEKRKRTVLSSSRKKEDIL